MISSESGRLLARKRPSDFSRLPNLGPNMNLLLTVMLLCLAADPNVEVVAHRGESFDAPENTLAAFQLAWSRKVTTIELDVHLTKDGQLIVCHDPNTKKTTGSDKAIKNSTLAELRSLDAGSWKGKRFAGEKLPTLAEALATIPGHGRCFIELKSGAEAVPALVRVIEECGKRPAQLAIISFNAETIAEAKRKLPQHPVYWIVSVKKDKATGLLAPSVEELISKAKSIKADGLDLSVPPTPDFVKPIKSAGLKLFIWTVNDVDVARKFVELGVDGITTDRAAWLKEQLAP